MHRFSFQAAFRLVLATSATSLAMVASARGAQVSAAASEPTATLPSATVAAVLREQPLLAGAAWYPEQWPEARWEADLDLMQKAHLHVVRMAEFAWSTMEPSEGQFEFTWLDHAIAAAARHDIKVVLGTPTAAPPVWLTSKYPDTLRVEDNGQRAEHGNRAQESFTSPTYRRFAARIAEEMAKRYGHNPDVLGWQIDNELSEISFGDSAKAAFHAWLKARYGTIAELNRSWATAYWSQTYDTFDQIPVHAHNENPALLLDWKRFVTDTWIGYVNNQTSVMRPHLLPRQWITTNTMGWYPGFDHYKLHKVVDLAAWDDYVGNGKLDPFLNAASHDLVRGYKQQNFWVMETQPAFVNWAPVNAALPRGAVREMAWQAVGHGADAVLYWQWRAAPNGQEEYHGVLVGADGTPVPVYDEVKQLAGEFERVGKAFEGTTPLADVAILQDYDSRWAIDFQKHTDRFDYRQQITDLYRALAPGKEGGATTIDLIPTSASLSRYKIVFAPALNVLPEATAKHLLEYVNGGGMLVLGTRSGMKREDNGLQPERQPGPLAAALGGRVAQFYALIDPVPVLHEGAPAGTAAIWAEQLQGMDPATKTLLTYGSANGWLDGQPAALRHNLGKGAILYLGAELEVPALRAFVLPLLTERGVQPLLRDLPPGVELMQRVGQGHKVWVIENHGDASAHVDFGQAARNLLDSSTSTSRTLDLPAHGVAVVTPSATR